MSVLMQGMFVLVCLTTLVSTTMHGIIMYQLLKERKERKRKNKRLF